MGIKIYKTDDAFFKKETENSFYVAGFVAADGYLHREKNRNRYRISIELSSKDEDHLNKIKTVMSSTVKIFKRCRYDPRFLESSRISSIGINSKEIYEDLSKFGVVANKSKIYKIPDWIANHPLKNHFMRGIFDGDGGFSFKNDNIIFYIYGTYDELDVYNKILITECRLHENKISKNRGCFRLEYAAKQDVDKIIKFLYYEANIFLDRKFNIIKDYL
jgi:LAGLIDADG-like domain